MVIILEILLILAAVGLIINRKNSQEHKLLGVSLLWLSLYVLTVVIYISKKGGIVPQMNPFFFLTNGIKTEFQFLAITLKQLGYLMAIGRTLFPVFILKTALKNNLVPRFRHLIIYSNWFWLPIIIILIIYYPSVFMLLMEKMPSFTLPFIRLLDFLLVAYVLLALIIVITELFSIQLKMYRQQYLFFTFFFFITCLIYFTYFLQNPISVFQFYTLDFVWQRGLFSLLSLLQVRLYVVLLIVTFLASIGGIIVLSKYTHFFYKKNKLETKLRLKKNAGTPATTMFIHGIKNQLLANNIVYKRISLELEHDQVDVAKVKEYIDKLNSENKETLKRIENLYKSIRENRVVLQPYDIDSIFGEIIKKYRAEYPDGMVTIDIQSPSKVLLDRELFTDAIMNLLSNAQESILLKGIPEGRIDISVYNVRAYCVIEIKDNGMGIQESDELKIFEPFYSSKNSKSNWGMGLYFVKSIIEQHYGDINVHTSNENGATFIINIPLYQKGGAV